MKAVCSKHQQGYEISQGCPYCQPTVASAPVVTNSQSRFGVCVQMVIGRVVVWFEEVKGPRLWLVECAAGGYVIGGKEKPTNGDIGVKYSQLVLKNPKENIFWAFLNAIQEKGGNPLDKTPYTPSWGMLSQYPLGRIRSASLGTGYVLMGPDSYGHRFHFGITSDPQYQEFLEALCLYAGYTP